MNMITAQITNVGERTVTRRDGSGQFTLFEVHTSAQQRPFTARADVAAKARSLIGAYCNLITRVEQNGQYTNYYLDNLDIAPQQPDATGQIIQTAQQAQPQQIAQPTPSPPQHRETPDETRQSIHRQQAVRYAAKLSQNGQEFWLNVAELYQYMETGFIPQRVAQPVAAGYDDDIPF